MPISYDGTSDLLGAPLAVAFGTATARSSRWWNGRRSGLEIGSVSLAGPKMTVVTSAPF